MIKAGIVGGAGYTAGELIRLLINHPDTEIIFINSSSNAGNRITDVHEGLYGECDLRFTDKLPLNDIDVLFCCMGVVQTTHVTKPNITLSGSLWTQPLL